jgi:RNase adapter protein RapZ
MRLIIITGLSGSGKSVALKALEDGGYYTTDNLPAILLPEMVAFLEDTGYTRVAVSIDARSGDTLNQLPRHVTDLKARGVDVRVLFLDAKSDALLKRFSETRRRHPLSNDKLTVAECILSERETLAEIGALSHHIDTSDISPNALRAWIKDIVDFDQSGITLMFESFGFKHGIPLDADLVYDVRCLPNPFYDPTLRPLTGKDQPVIDFLATNANVKKMLSDITTFIEDWLPSFIADHRNYFTVAIGCTGGEHRSVYFVESLARHFKPDQRVLLRHRELEGGMHAVSGKA